MAPQKASSRTSNDETAGSFTEAERAAMIVFTTEMTERRCAGKN